MSSSKLVHYRQSSVHADFTNCDDYFVPEVSFAELFVITARRVIILLGLLLYVIFDGCFPPTASTY